MYTKDEIIGLSEYYPTLDNIDRYNCWQDAETQAGFNHMQAESFEEFAAKAIKSRFTATIVRLSDSRRIGAIFLSPENTLPDLAIMIYKPYRGMGYGTRAFALGAEYCLNALELGCVYAGCYPDNDASRAMLRKCGFIPHPEGNLHEKHFLTGKDIIQMDFVKRKAVPGC